MPSDLEEANKEVIRLLNKTSSGEIRNRDELQNAIQKKAELIKNFTSGTKYKEYLGKQRLRIDTIQMEKKKYWTAEMVELDKKIKAGQAELVQK